MQDKGGDCRRRNVGYKITCMECQAEYHGETSRTMYSRGQEHQKGLDKKTKDSVLWNHCETEHDGIKMQFQMKATGYFTDPLTRQIDEAVRIHHTRKSMNRRGEWRKTAVPRVTFVRE